jgi:hypothetical protein
MKERGFAILLHLRSAAPWENFTSYSCDDFCKRERFASLWKPPAKKHRHRVRAELRAVPKLLLVVLLRGEKLGRRADEPDKRREMGAHSHRSAQLSPLPSPAYKLKVSVQRTATLHPSEI